MSEASRPFRTLRILLVLLVVVFIVGVFCFRRLGAWLIVEDPLEPAHAIVVLNGRLPDRAREAAALYHQSYAARVWVTRALGPEKELEKLNITYIGEDFYDTKVLMALGVPFDAVRSLGPPIRNTADEIDVIARTLREENGAKVIIVASKSQSRRVRALWQKLVGDSPRLIVRYPPQEEFDAARWWSNTRDAFEVLREVLGLINAWTGLRVRPAES